MRVLVLDGEWNRQEKLLLMGILEEGSFQALTKEEDYKALADRLESERDLLVVGHNIRSDLLMLMKAIGKEVWIAGHVWDTMIGQMVLKQKSGWENRGYSLKNLIEIYLGKGFEEKEELRERALDLKEASQELIDYNKKDLTLTYQVFLKQRDFFKAYTEEIKRDWKAFANLKSYAGISLPISVAIEMKFVNLLAISEFYGVQLEADLIRAYKEEMEKQLIRFRMEFKERFRVEAGQVKKLQAMLGVRTLDKRKQTEEEKEKSKEVLELREKITKLEKELGLAKALIEVAEGKKRPEVRQIGAPTGRMAYAEPNLQQVPRDSKLREYINKDCVKMDFATIELRLAGQYVKQLFKNLGIEVKSELVKALQEGKDLHTITSQKIFGKEDISKEERQIGKAVNFASLYGITPESLQETVYNNTGKQLDGKNLLEGFYQSYPELRKWHLLVKEGGTVITLGGRLIKAKTRNEALNYPIQASGAEVLKLFSLIVYTTARSLGLKVIPVLYIHDEVHFLTCNTKEDDIHRVLQEGKRAVEKFLLRDVPFEYEIKNQKEVSHV